MPSPFPGMDPYLEDPAFWEGFHHVFITECMYHISDGLPEPYVANVEERVHVIGIHDAAAEQYIPDIGVARQREGGSGRGAGSAGTATAVLEPVTIPSIDSIEVREAYIEIRRLPDYELVTAVELLSPWNKFGEGIGEYRMKRRGLVRRGVHVVEIDLLTRGSRTELAAPLPAGDYYAMIFRADRQPDVNVYAWRVRDPLPTIPVPLRKPDADVGVELAAVVTSAYDRGHYARKLRYGRTAPAALREGDAAWAGDVAAWVPGVRR